MTTADDAAASAPDDSAAASRARWLTKRNTFVLLVVPALLLLLLATRTWVTGRTGDPVLGPAPVSVTGSEAAPGVVALGAVALAALVAIFTGGRRIRRVSAVLLTLAGAGTVALSLQVVADPAGAVGRKAAAQLGRTGSVAAEAALTPAAWLGAAACLALTMAGILGVVAVGYWEGLSARFDRPGSGEPGDPSTSADGRGARRSAWDELSDGRDPTVDPDSDRT